MATVSLLPGVLAGDSAGDGVGHRVCCVRLGARGGGPMTEQVESVADVDVQLLAWAITNCHTLARRALAHTTSVYDREKWEHVLRICEKAGAKSKGVLRAAVPTEITGG